MKKFKFIIPINLIKYNIDDKVKHAITVTYNIIENIDFLFSSLIVTEKELCNFSVEDIKNRNIITKSMIIKTMRYFGAPQSSYNRVINILIEMKEGSKLFTRKSDKMENGDIVFYMNSNKSFIFPQFVFADKREMNDYVFGHCVVFEDPEIFKYAFYPSHFRKFLLKAITLDPYIGRKDIDEIRVSSITKYQELANIKPSPTNFKSMVEFFNQFSKQKKIYKFVEISRKLYRSIFSKNGNSLFLTACNILDKKVSDKLNNLVLRPVNSVKDSTEFFNNIENNKELISQKYFKLEGHTIYDNIDSIKVVSARLSIKNYFKKMKRNDKKRYNSVRKNFAKKNLSISKIYKLFIDDDVRRAVTKDKNKTVKVVNEFKKVKAIVTTNYTSVNKIVEEIPEDLNYKTDVQFVYQIEADNLSKAISKLCDLAKLISIKSFFANLHMINKAMKNRPFESLNCINVEASRIRVKYFNPINSNNYVQKNSVNNLFKYLTKIACEFEFRFKTYDQDDIVYNNLSSIAYTILSSIRFHSINNSVEEIMSIRNNVFDKVHKQGISLKLYSNINDFRLQMDLKHRLNEIIEYVYENNKNITPYLKLVNINFATSEEHYKLIKAAQEFERNAL